MKQDSPDIERLIANGAGNTLTVLLLVLLTYFVLMNWSRIRDTLARILSAIDSFVPSGVQRSDDKYPFFVGREVLRLLQIAATWIAGLAPIGTIVAIFENGRASLENMGDSKAENGSSGANDALSQALDPIMLLVSVEFGRTPLVTVSAGIVVLFLALWHVSRFERWLAGQNP